jgi:hypothetical protein
VAEDDQPEARRHGRLWRRVWIGLAVCAALLVIFHRPILLAIGRRIVLQYAAKKNLKADFRVEGNRRNMKRLISIISTLITVGLDLRGTVFLDCSTTLKRARPALS